MVKLDDHVAQEQRTWLENSSEAERIQGFMMQRGGLIGGKTEMNENEL